MLEKSPNYLLMFLTFPWCICILMSAGVYEYGGPKLMQRILLYHFSTLFFVVESQRQTQSLPTGLVWRVCSGDAICILHRWNCRLMGFSCLDSKFFNCWAASQHNQDYLTAVKLFSKEHKMQVLRHSFLDLSANELGKSNIYSDIWGKDDTLKFGKLCLCI